MSVAVDIVGATLLLLASRYHSAATVAALRPDAPNMHITWVSEPGPGGGGRDARGLPWLDGCVDNQAQLRATTNATLCSNVLVFTIDARGLGRWFAQKDDSPSSPETVFLTDGYWQRRFGGDKVVIGRSVTVDSRPGDVVGVMPEGFIFLNNRPDMILPQRFDRTGCRPTTIFSILESQGSKACGGHCENRQAGRLTLTRFVCSRALALLADLAVELTSGLCSCCHRSFHGRGRLDEGLMRTPHTGKKGW